MRAIVPASLRQSIRLCELSGSDDFCDSKRMSCTKNVPYVFAGVSRVDDSRGPENTSQ
jgi:hypothetical protein